MADINLNERRLSTTATDINIPTKYKDMGDGTYARSTYGGSLRIDGVARAAQEVLHNN